MRDNVRGISTMVYSWLDKVAGDKTNKAATDIHVCVHGNSRVARSIDTTNGQFFSALIVKVDGETGLLASILEIFLRRTTPSMKWNPSHPSNLHSHTRKATFPVQTRQSPVRKYNL